MADSGKHVEQTTVERSPTDNDHPATDGHAARAIDKALLGGEPQRVGRFEYRYDGGAWTWSDAVARMHGYEPGEIEPTTELVLSHKHPDDLPRVKRLLQQSAAPFSSRHRIRTTTGDIRKVVVVGDPVTDTDGRIVATRGFYIDITESFNTDLQQSITDELQIIVSHREVIDQAKGMLMVIYSSAQMPPSQS
jgi:PAS domain S-box-containing protein